MAKLFFFGHSCFGLEDGDSKILIDPFVKENPHLSDISFDFDPGLLLITHGHYDHLGDAIEMATEKNCTILAQPEIVDFCQKMGVKEATKVNYGGRVRFEFGSVKMVPAWHTSSIGEERLYGGNACGYVVNFAGKNFYHAGDTALFGDMKLIGETDVIDVALLPIGDRYTMGVDDAIMAVLLLNPDRVIPMHFNTFDVIRQDPSEFKKRVESETSARCSVMKPGEHLEIG